MITAETLHKFAPKLKDPDIHARALESARKTSTVTTARRLCHFLGQIFVETGGFVSMGENLHYKNPERRAAPGARYLEIVTLRLELQCRGRFTWGNSQRRIMDVRGRLAKHRRQWVMSCVPSEILIRAIIAAGERKGERDAEIND